MQEEKLDTRIDTTWKWASKWGVEESVVEEVLVGVEKDYGLAVGRFVRDHMDLVMMRADVYMRGDVFHGTDADNRQVLRLSMVEHVLKCVTKRR